MHEKGSDQGFVGNQDSVIFFDFRTLESEKKSVKSSVYELANIYMPSANDTDIS